MSSILPPHLLKQWTPNQALAVYEFCVAFSEELWVNYESQFIAQMAEQERAELQDEQCTAASQQMHLDLWQDNAQEAFNDEIPF